MLKNTRSAQARINGAKSQGPKTPDGKARSCRNSLRHGRYADHAIVLSNEDQAAFDELADSYIRRIGPRDSVETRYARELASIDWRLDRIRAMETRMFDHEMDIQAPMLEATHQYIPELTRLVQASEALVKNSSFPAYLANRESALQYARQAALSALKQLRQSHPLPESCLQIIDPKPLSPENNPGNEPETNLTE